MLLNRKGEIFGDQTQPMWKDLFFSLLLHAVALTMMIIFALWKEQKHDEPLKRIEVTMISGKELASLQQRANPVNRPENRSTQSRFKPTEPELIRSPQTAPKPAVKPNLASKPKLKLQAKLAPTVPPQTADKLETVLKPEALREPVILPEVTHEPVTQPEQLSETVVKLEPAMKPVAKFEPAVRSTVRLEAPAKPVLKLRADPADMKALSEPVINMEPKPVPVINAGSIPRPISKLKTSILPKPALKSVVVPITKQVTKIKIPLIAKPETDPDYDPFSPMKSDSDKELEALDSFQSELPRITEKQLSQKEINRYIGRIQAAVEKQWKIPVAIYNIKDPLVEMILQPGGQIQLLRILESSGNTTLDTSLIRAIHAAAPFEIPKEQFEYFRVNRIRFHPF